MNATELIAKVKNLAPVSQSALKLVGLLDQPAISNEDIVQVLKFDTVLTAKLLRACNSPFFGLEEPVSSVEQAVLILGHQQILHIALSIAFSSTMAAPLPGYAAEAKELWQHSLVAAMASENIARNSNALSVDAPVAFTAGLLHDIGKVVMNQVLTPDARTALLDRIASNGQSRTEAEREIIGVDHADIGKCLLETWRLPDTIIEAVGNHHHPVSRPEPKLSCLVHTANCLAHVIGSNLGWEAFAERADAGAIEVLDIDQIKLDELVVAAHESMCQVEQLMQMA
ncbi:MAG TPA: HDOD domain-containing protein [Verrucomicrobiae bacterium]|nr:HDOD domain-containing protein [Verrucomicrobiae bacterium]